MSGLETLAKILSLPYRIKRAILKVIGKQPKEQTK